MRASALARGSAVCLVLLSSACAAEVLKSGPQPGDDVPGPFHVLNVTGPSAGQKNCQI